MPPGNWWWKQGNGWLLDTCVRARKQRPGQPRQRMQMTASKVEISPFPLFSFQLTTSPCTGWKSGIMTPGDGAIFCCVPQTRCDYHRQLSGLAVAIKNPESSFVKWALLRLWEALAFQTLPLPGQWWLPPDSRAALISIWTPDHRWRN